MWSFPVFPICFSTFLFSFSHLVGRSSFRCFPLDFLSYPLDLLLWEKREVLSPPFSTSDYETSNGQSIPKSGFCFPFSYLHLSGTQSSGAGCDDVTRSRFVFFFYFLDSESELVPGKRKGYFSVINSSSIWNLSHYSILIGFQSSFSLRLDHQGI